MINFELPKAFHVGPKAEVETLSSYEDRLEYYKERDYTYIPIPTAKKFYDVESEELRDLKNAQILNLDHAILKVWYALRKHPFVLVRIPFREYWVSDSGEVGIGDPPDEEGDRYSYPWHVVESHRDIGSEDLLPYENERYKILTLADLNRRKAKEILYALISAVETEFSTEIEKALSSEEVFEDVKPETIGRWRQDQLDGMTMHIAEYMTTGGLKKVAAKNEEVYENLGFPSRNQFEKQFSGMSKLRRPVMHPNRSLVEDKEDLEEHLDRIERLYEFLRDDLVDVRIDSEPQELLDVVGEEKDVHLAPIFLEDHEHPEHYKEPADRE